jgi:hypothetical protein
LDFLHKFRSVLFPLPLSDLCLFPLLLILQFFLFDLHLVHAQSTLFVVDLPVFEVVVFDEGALSFQVLVFELSLSLAEGELGLLHLLSFALEIANYAQFFQSELLFPRLQFLSELLDVLLLLSDEALE